MHAPIEKNEVAGKDQKRLQLQLKNVLVSAIIPFVSSKTSSQKQTPAPAASFCKCYTR
jgi:hypothetical protein